MSHARGTKSGKVYLVGAGPGDPGLLTLRAAECLGRADLVLYDYLVNPVILDHTSSSAERVCLGHHRTGRTIAQEEICVRMTRAAGQGRMVVRLKGGDPNVFARAAEECEALSTAGVEFEIVPGITASLAAAGYAEIPLAHGDRVSAVALVTGQQRRDKGDLQLDYGKLADFPGMLIFYMGVTGAQRWSQALIDRGKSPQTPVAVVRRGCWPDQRTVRCTLGTVAEVVARRKLRPPAVIFVGAMVDSAPEVSWFAARPLHGICTLVTSPREESEMLQRQLSELGADVWTEPAVRISDPLDFRPVDEALGRLDQYDWLVFWDASEVRSLLNRLLDSGSDLRRLGKVKLAAVGPGTVDQLAGYHLRADLVPRDCSAESLSEALPGRAAGQRLLVARRDGGSQALADRLNSSGAAVDQIAVCCTSAVGHLDPEVAAALAKGRIDWVAVTGPAIARSLVELLGDDLRRSKLASIDPTTSKVLRKLGYDPVAEAVQHTATGLAEAIAGACS